MNVSVYFRKQIQLSQNSALSASLTCVTQNERWRPSLDSCAKRIEIMTVKKSYLCTINGCHLQALGRSSGECTKYFKAFVSVLLNCSALFKMFAALEHKLIQSGNIILFKEMREVYLCRKININKLCFILLIIFIIKE